MESLVKTRNLHKGRLGKIQATVNKHDVVAQVEVSDKFSIQIHKITTKLLQIKATLLQTQPPPVVPAQIKLPQIDPPTFDGQFENWQSFQDLFTSSIGNNNSLSNSQKLQYLKSCVKSDAANLIKSFAVTDLNYAEAWTVLKNRYDNKRELVDSIMKKIFNQPALKTETVAGLQQLLDTTNECVRSLSVLGQPIDKCDDFLVYLVVDKMNSTTRREWAMSLKGSEPATFKELQEFLEIYIRGLHASGDQSKPSGSSNGDRKQVSSHHATYEDSCPLCKLNHHLYKCKKFIEMEVQQRLECVKSKSLCFNCFKKGHSSNKCLNKNTCKKCNRQHHTMLHIERAPSSQPPPVPAPAAGNSTTVNTCFEKESTQVLLNTALGHIQDHEGHDQVCRMLKDDGSKTALITEVCVKRLGLKRKKCHVTIRGISSIQACIATSKVSLIIKSLYRQASITVEALVVPSCTEYLPSYPCDPSHWTHIQGLQLADPKFHTPGPIDIIIGGDVTASLILDGIRLGPRHSPVAQNTIFGWMLSGRINSILRDPVSIHHANCDTDTILQRFWELEELPSIKHLTEEEKSCEDHFTDTHSRKDDGRYVVKLPFNHKKKRLVSTRDKAVTRFMSLERKFRKYPSYRDEYVKFMREYESLQHMKQIPFAAIHLESAYYLPHHFVLKEDSTTTKLRVVFDGSATDINGISLNDALMVGPTIQDDLFALLLRFRCNPVALKADIAKRYRQFMVDDDDANYQRIVWRESPDKPLKDFKLLTITYGTASAPFQATRCLQQLAKDESEFFPATSQVILKDVYVDDLMSGESTAERAINLQQEVSELVSRGGMEIRKWATNDPIVLNSIPEHLRETGISLDFDSDSSLKALGVRWITSSDHLVFSVGEMKTEDNITKRILSLLTLVPF